MTTSIRWPSADSSRVPYNVFLDEKIFEQEQKLIFRGKTWCYLALEAEIPNPFDYITSFVGNTPVVVTRDDKGNISAFVNRCAHKGATLVRDIQGNCRSHTCVYHHWTYDSKGELTGVPFQRGWKGNGGMPPSFNKREHCLPKLRVQSHKGVIFGSFSQEVPDLTEYLDAPMRQYIDTLFSRRIEVLGYMRQRMSSNWKLYWENTIDPYHAGLLHKFGTTFGFFRPTQEGGFTLGAEGKHALEYSLYGTDEDTFAEVYEGVEAYNSELKLADPSVLDYRDEEGDGRGLVIMSVFPSVIFQRISNTLATRQIRPKSAHEFELYWTVFGYADDDLELRALRLKQLNMIGPAGLISMEDGVSGVLIQKGIEARASDCSVLEMGGIGEIKCEESHMFTEVPVRAFWQQYSSFMGFMSDDR